MQVHHIVPLREGGAPYDLSNTGTVCSRHHPVWEALRREVIRRRDAELGDDMLRRARLVGLVRHTGHEYLPRDLRAELVRMGARDDEVEELLGLAARRRREPVAA